MSTVKAPKVSFLLLLSGVVGLAPLSTTRQLDAALITTIDWASSFHSDVNVRDPENALGSPDGSEAIPGPLAFPNPGSIVYADFGLSTVFRTQSLAGLLGISDADIGSADFIAFEAHSTANLAGFESSSWTFSDGELSVQIVHQQGGALPAGVLEGNVGHEAFNAVMGADLHDVNVAWILFDLSDFDVLSPSFEVSIAVGGGFGANPDLLGLGTLRTQTEPPAEVPEPATLLLLAGAAVTLAARRRSRKAPYEDCHR